MSPPSKLSLITGVYNAAAFLDRTIESIQGQSFSAFEWILVDDGSTDESRQILESYARQDPRMRVLSLPCNKGVSNALNTAFEASSGEYVGLVDSDDLYFPQRFEKQVGFLSANPDYAIVGSSRLLINEEGSLLGWEEMPHYDMNIRWRCLFNSPFLQPSVVFRRACAEKLPYLYDTKRKAAEDYDLWRRLLTFGKGFNFKEPFLHYRVRTSSLSEREKPHRRSMRDETSNLLFKETFGDHGLTAEQINRIRYLFVTRPRFFDTAATRPFEVAQPEDIQLYAQLLSAFIAPLSAIEARHFLCAERVFLGQEYLASVGLPDPFFDELLQRKTAAHTP